MSQSQPDFIYLLTTKECILYYLSDYVTSLENCEQFQKGCPSFFHLRWITGIGRGYHDIFFEYVIEFPFDISE